MYKQNRYSEGIITHQVFSGQVNKVMESDSFIVKEGGYKAMISQKNYCSGKIYDLLENHVVVAAQSSGFSHDYFAGLLYAQCCSNLYWETGINSFNELEVDINEVMLVDYVAVHKKLHNCRVLQNMLWNLEYYALDCKKTYIVAAIDINNFAAIKAFLNVGYIIKNLDVDKSCTRAVLFKNLDWSVGVNFYLGFQFGGNAGAMLDPEHIQNNIKSHDFYRKVKLLDINKIQEMLHNGYYPCNIIDGCYVCYQVKGISDDNIKQVEQSACAA